MISQNKWSNTTRTVDELRNLLKCGICNRLLQNACTLGHCEHYFCWDCVTNKCLGESCPTCGMPSHVKDVQRNRQLDSAVMLSEKLSCLLSLMTGQPKKTEQTSVHQVCFSNPDVGTENKIVETTAEETAAIVPEKQMKKPEKKSNVRIAERKITGKNCAENTKVVKTKGWIVSSSEASVSEGSNLTQISDLVNETGKNKDGIKDVSREECIVPNETERAQQTEDVVNFPKQTRCSEDKNLPADCSSVQKQSRKSFACDETIDNVPKRKRSKRSTDALSKTDNMDAIIPTCLSEPKNFKPKKLETASVSKQVSSNVVSASLMSPQNRLIQSEMLLLSEGRKGLNFSTPKSQRVGRGKWAQKLLLPPSPNVSLDFGLDADTTSKNVSTDLDVSRTSSKLGSSPTTPRTGTARKRNVKGETGLHVACIRGDTQTVRQLLTDGFNPNVKDFANWTPLHEACNHGFVEIAEMLLDHGAAIDAIGDENFTPLHDAVQNSRLDCIQLLVSRGASKTARTLQGKTPIDLALYDVVKEALNFPVSKELSKKTLLNTSVRSLTSDSPPTEIVVTTTGLSRETRDWAEKVAKDLNFKISEKFTNKVTHVITITNKSRVCPRTIKFMSAVLTGKWIVCVDWLKSCEEKKSWVSEDDFEVYGCNSSPKSFAARLGRRAVEEQLPGLFHGCHFYIIPGLVQNSGPSKDDLIRLIQLGSGSILTREPKLETIDQLEFTVPYHASTDSLLVDCGYFVVENQKEQKVTMIGSRICRVDPSWVLACAAQFRLVHV